MTCALCQKDKPLRTSHILPKFVFKWLKKTSATGHIRFADAPNKRVQDGLKLPFLCSACEAKLNKFETEFSKKLFHPWGDISGQKIVYEEWLLRFCVSISWRVLKYAQDNLDLSHLSAEQQNKAQNACTRWAGFLNNDFPHPGVFENHILPFDGVVSHTIKSAPKNLNRYLLRAVEIDVAADTDEAFTFAKLGSFMIFGFIERPTSKWQGSKVQLKSGVIKPCEYQFPRKLLEYFLSRARKYEAIQSGISGNQQEAIEHDLIKQRHRFLSSGTYEAMRLDEALFGRGALLKGEK